MNPAKSSIQSIDLDDLERRLRDFVDPASPDVASGGHDRQATTARVENIRIATETKPSSVRNGQGASSPGGSARPVPAAVKLTDLDAVERRLREVASAVLRKPAAASKQGDEVLTKLARIVGRDTRSEGANREDAEKVRASSVTPIDRKGSPGTSSPKISDAYQGRAARAAMKRASGIGESRKPREADSAGGTDRQGGRAKSSQGEIVRRFEHEARTFLAGAAARLDGIERVTAEPEGSAHATVVTQSVLLRSARSLALPLLLLALGTGTAIVMLSPVGELPRGQMKEAKPQAPVASPRSVAEAAVSSATSASASLDRTVARPAKSEPPAEVAKSVPVPSAAASIPAVSSRPADVPPEKDASMVSADPALAAPQTLAPPPPSPSAPAVLAAPPPAAIASNEAPRSRAPVTSSTIFSGTGSPDAAPLAKAEDATAAAPAPVDIAGPERERSLPAAEPVSSASATEKSGAAAVQLPDYGSAPAADATAPRTDPQALMPPPATEGSAVANSASPPAAPDATGMLAPSPGAGAETTANPQAEASPTAKLPSPNPPRAIELGKTTSGPNGEGTPSPKTTAPADRPSEGLAPPASPSPAKTAGVTIASKPVLTRPAKSAALIATSHMPPARATKPPPAPVAPEPKPTDQNAQGASTVGAPLMITPPEAPEPMLEASAAPSETPETAETPEKTIVPRPAPASGGAFSLRLASSLSESDARATLSQLQKEFPGALQNGSVTRDNLGSVGVFYRVKVGPLSREVAERVCSRLRTAGRKCVLTRG
jgi:hypothetical protein